MRHHSPGRIALWTLVCLALAACQPGPPPSASVAFVVFDAGETLGLLPVAASLRSTGTEVTWLPLTPWAAELLSANGEPSYPLPDGASGMSHVQDRNAVSEVGYWEEVLIGNPPALVVLGMVSVAQGQISDRLRDAGISTRGFFDGFQPPTPGSIGAETAPSYDEIWVPTDRVREGFQALGLGALVVGQPSLESWRRAAEEVDRDAVRRRQGIGAADHILLFAGQYGPGYEEVLGSFLGAIQELLVSDSSGILVLSPHPRTDGTAERSALEKAGLPRAVMAVEGISTMELATTSDVILTWNSTVGVQAAFMGKRVVYFEPPKDFDSDLVERGIAVVAGESSLVPLLGGILADELSPEIIRETLVASGYVVNADRVMAEMISRIIGS